MLRSACLLAVTTLGLAHAEGPLFRSGEAGLMGAFGLPVSKFAGEEDGDGHARPGLGGGLDILAHLPWPYLSFSSGIYCLWNPIEIDNTPSSLDLGSWINIPFVTGLRAQTAEIGNAARLFAQAQAGINFASQTDTEGPRGTLAVGWSPSMAYSFGFGAILLNRIHVGARYFHLGEPEYHVSEGGGSLGTQEPRVFALMIGAYFETAN